MPLKASFSRYWWRKQKNHCSSQLFNHHKDKVAWRFVIIQGRNKWARNKFQNFPKSGASFVLINYNLIGGLLSHWPSTYSQRGVFISNLSILLSSCQPVNQNDPEITIFQRATNLSVPAICLCILLWSFNWKTDHESWH